MEKRTLFAILVFLGAVSFLFDAYLASFMASLQHPALNYFMSWFSHLGTLLIAFLVMTSLFMLEEKKVKWIKVAWLSFLAAFVFSAALKLLFGRARPLEYLALPGLLYSFPSAHTAMAFSLVPVLDKAFPKLKWFWIGFASLIGLSRIYIGAHYLSDVVWGCLLGYLIGSVVVWLEEKNKLWRFPWKTRR